MESVHHHHHHHPHHVSVPLRAGKKMKKRKELDALVAHSAGKRACNGGGASAGAAVAGGGVHKRPAGGASSQDQLLSESTDEQDDYWSGKSGSGGGGGVGGGGGGGARTRAPRILLRRRACGSLLRACTAALVFACVVATVTVMWLFIDIREQVTSLRSKLDQVVAGSQSYPDSLQKIHTMSKGLQQNQTALFTALNTVYSRLDNFSSQLTVMHNNLQEVQGKLKAAPELVNVPQNLKELKESVASFGSQIKGFDDTVTELKNQNSKLQEMSKILVTNITSIQQTVAILLNGSHQVHQEENAEEKKAFLMLTSQLSQNISIINETLNSKIKWIDDEEKNDRARLERLQDQGQNISARVTTMEGECVKASAQVSLLQQIGNLTDQVASSDTKLRDLSNRFIQFQSNSSQLQGTVINLQDTVSGLISQSASQTESPRSP